MGDVPKAIPGKNVNVLFGEALLKKIEAFRWREKLNTKTEAIRVLVERGLKARGPAE